MLSWGRVFLIFKTSIPHGWVLWTCGARSETKSKTLDQQELINYPDLPEGAAYTEQPISRGAPDMYVYIYMYVEIKKRICTCVYIY